MSITRIDGSERDFERFSKNALQGSAAIEFLSPFERRMSWNLRDRSGVTCSTVLRSGISLSATRVKWERPWSVELDMAPSRLKFVLARGPGPRVTTGEHEARVLDGGVFQVGQAKSAVRVRFDFEEPTSSQDHEQLALEIDNERLRELLGSSQLPSPIENMLAVPSAYPTHSQPMIPDLFRLLDEIAYCDARGASRRLRLEAKGLELLAAMIDQFEESARAASPLLSQYDIDRLQRARHILLARIEAPPSLPELARLAGLNEAKLKGGFRTLFGSSVYGYLRDHRMDEARRLLKQRRYSVIEVAQRVGYANPSKFAAAFRKRFGVSPSGLT